MEYIKDGQNYLIRLEKEEEIMTSLQKFMLDEKIPSGLLKGLGALKDVELGFYELEKKTYIRKKFPPEAELLSLIGNLSWKEGSTAWPHIHVVLGDANFNAFGGHLFTAKVAVTVELYLETCSKKVSREFDDITGLHLLRCQC